MSEGFANTTAFCTAATWDDPQDTRKPARLSRIDSRSARRKRRRQRRLNDSGPSSWYRHTPGGLGRDLTLIYNRAHWYSYVHFLSATRQRNDAGYRMMKDFVEQNARFRDNRDSGRWRASLLHARDRSKFGHDRFGLVLHPGVSGTGFPTITGTRSQNNPRPGLLLTGVLKRPRRPISRWS